VRRITQAEFIERAKLVHGNRFDYSETYYVRMAIPILIGCRKHGSFTHLPQPHLLGLIGCGQCNGQTSITKEVFIARSRKAHGHLALDYGRVKQFFGGGIKDQMVTLTCNQHQIKFQQSAWQNLKGQNGCWKCAPNSKLTQEKFLWKANLTYPDKQYDYSLVDYSVGIKGKIRVGCPRESHGFFVQTMDGHLSGREGCSHCSRASIRSRGEQELGDFLEENNYLIERNNRKMLEGLELDVWIPALNTGVEYNGNYWHRAGNERDRIKHERAKGRGIVLLTIWDNDWKNNLSLSKNAILRKLSEIEAELKTDSELWQ
jgi:hypothetical protein